MFTGFRLTNHSQQDWKGWIDSPSYFHYKGILSEYQRSIQRAIETYVDDNGGLSGEKISEDWFPVVSSDVFISHSHADERIAVFLAGWLKEELNIDVFVDSLVWKQATALLKKLDDKYCRNPYNNCYDYNKMQITSSHVYLILSTAIQKMIDKCECFLFLDTQNSVINRNPLRSLDTHSYSPWIYYELEISSCIRIRELSESREIKKSIRGQLGELKHAISYKLETNHLYPIDLVDFINTFYGCIENGLKHYDALDTLYARFIEKG